jgi:Protein of unknown function (DUF2778)
MKYTYNRYWGAFYNPDNSYYGPGYSGQPGFMNDPSNESIIGRGPLPAGLYTITQIISDDPHTGILSCVLEPASTNKMYGRSGFRIHGDNQKNNHSASDGCIITPHDVREKFVVGDQIEVV